MTLSIWRYSHLALAVSSFLFLIVVAVTGIILAFEPIQTEWKQIEIPTAADVSLAQTMDALQANYLEILELSVTKNGKVQASVITDEGDVADFYINPLTAEKVAEIEEQSTVYQFAKTLHRSLFLKSTGRFFIALTSFLLCIITITGGVLIVKRQQGFQKIFHKIIKDNFWQHAHTYFGRLFLIPIILLSCTGVVLALFQFRILEHATLQHQIKEELLVDHPAVALSDFPILKHTLLSEVKSIDFPFSTDVEDYYQLNLEDREILVNQYTGAVLSERLYPFSEIAYQWSLHTHTGEKSVIWAFILLLSTVSILFFIVSGFKLTFKRRKGSIKNKYKASESTHIILVGSESGSTFPFAIWLQKQLIQSGKKVFVAEMNAYETYPQLEQLFILTATYGVGEAPVNATQFLSKLNNVQQSNFKFAVVGFGSFAYADYCQFAYDVEQALLQLPNAKPILHMHTVNNKSAESFNQWLLQYGQISGFYPDAFQTTQLTGKATKKKNYTVVSRTQLQKEHQTFLMVLEPPKEAKFKSGDLLAIAPSKTTHDRLYSVGMNAEGHILLSIKLHEKGLCSGYLNELVVGDQLKASLVKNKDFRFPKKASNVIMVATGTGIAPFLGMLAENTKQQPIHLFWGAKNAAAFDLYQDIIETQLANKHLSQFIPAYSRASANKVYVQDQLQAQASLIAEIFSNGGVVMICGSVVMQKSVLEVLAAICKNHCNKNLSYYQQKGQLLMDCY